MAQPLRATLDEIASTVPISAIQSATIACEISGRLDRWIRAKRPAGVVVPTLEDITVTQSGSIWWWRGRSVPPAQVVAALGALLQTLLQHVPAGRAPAGLLYVVARATEPRHLAPFRDLGEFHTALARYAAERRPLAIDALLARYQIARSGLPPLSEQSSISDVRRLRRAGRVTLAQIALDTGIPISLLRELEWGVYTNWNLAHSSTTLASYAERAGLDPDAVVQVIVREQAVVPVESWDASVDAIRASRLPGLLPFALAMTLLAALFVATPHDRFTPPAEPARVAERAMASARTANPPTTAAPASRSRHVVRRTPTRTAASSPRRSGQVSTASRLPATRTAAAPRPLLRLARAFVGDGRYRAEPFPKPK